MTEPASSGAQNGQSSLLTLPLEARTLIWNFVFPPTRATIDYDDGVWACDNLEKHIQQIFTCRPIYKETQDLAYSRLTLVLNNVPTSTHLPTWIPFHIYSRLRFAELVLESPFLKVADKKIQCVGCPDLSMLENLSHLTIRHLDAAPYEPALAWPQLVDRLKSLDPYSNPKRPNCMSAWRLPKYFPGQFPSCPISGIAETGVDHWVSDESDEALLKMVCRS